MATDRKVRLVATDSQKYGSRQLRPGDHFDADIYDAADMLAVGIVRTEEDVAIAVAAEANEMGIVTDGPTPNPQKRSYKRRALTVKVDPAREKRKYVKSGKYKRKDLRAED